MSSPRRSLSIFVFALLLMISGCKRGALTNTDAMYVAGQQVNLRDRVAAVYNKVGTAKNGEKVEILERQKRFARVRTPRGEEGWVELRSLVDEDVYKGFEKLAADNVKTPVQGRGTTRAELNMHMEPARDADKLYQLADGEKVEILKRATSERLTQQQIALKQAAEARVEQAQNAPPPRRSKKEDDKAPKIPLPRMSPQAPADLAKTPPEVLEAIAPKAAPGKKAVPAQQKLFDDWWLVRNKEGRVGWVLARMVDLDVPLEVAQYAEGQRIMGAYVLNTVMDDEKGKVPQFLVVMSEPKDGMPFDFNQLRVFSWNTKRHRYETAYRERNIMGFFPATVGSEDFGKEGVLPVFTVRKQNVDGSVSERKYRMIGPIVRQVFGPGEQEKKPALAEPHKSKKAKGR